MVKQVRFLVTWNKWPKMIVTVISFDFRIIKYSKFTMKHYNDIG
jgi:hypothetical protein